jgi:isoleucyl-tRNA synthetase
MLSTWYVRLSKRRFWESGVSEGKRAAYETLHAALETFAIVSAPFLPFLCESIHGALGRMQSVHLRDWPGPRPDWRDHELSDEMRIVRTIVRLTRSVRETHRVSHRQPLLSVAVANVPPEVISRNLDLLLVELNVKAIGALASLDAVAQPVVKLNYPVLGKRLRGQVKELQAAVDAGDYEILDGGPRLRVGRQVLESEDFSLHYAPIGESRGVAADGRLVVVVDLSVTPDLLHEKHIRDLNRGLQDLRKDAGLGYDERIRVGLVAPAALVDRLAPYLPWLSEETLAVEIVMGEIDTPAARTRVDVGDDAVDVMLRRA